jgi:stage V sporulation protein AD
MTKTGKQTWTFDTRPVYVISTATVAGQLESEGPLRDNFDVLHESDRLNGDTWEHSEQQFFDEAASTVLRKANLEQEAIDFMIGADLNAQLTSFYLGLRAFSIPSLGVYSACASICEALALGAMLIDSKSANYALVGTSSHNSTAERQFRYPTEYGAQKPPTAQRTVSGAGTAILGAKAKNDSDIVITHATIGRVVDFGVKSPWEMGAAMAPAAADTIMTHLKDVKRNITDYDCVATGDLGDIGHQILRELLNKNGITELQNLTDCGMLIYTKDQAEVFSGGSGGACCTLVTFGHLLRELQSGKWKRILVSATGALLSATSAGQSDSIPSVSHAIVFERRDVS